METDFYRIERLPPYVFAEVNRMKAEARARGEDIIDFGMGNPDSPTPPHIVEKLIECVHNPDTHRYSVSRGINGIRKAQAAYYERRFNVSLDPETEVIMTMGSKEGLANLATAISKPSDFVLVPTPNYPIHAYGFIIAGASVRYLPHTDTNSLMQQIRNAVEGSAPKPLALILNFPCNPTSATTTLDFYAEVVDFCKFHGVYIISDLAYCEIYFGAPPPSILEIPGAKDIAIEFTTLSKTYSMPGWRVGFGVGSPVLIKALTRIKSYLDYGAFTPIQVAATAALNGPQTCVEEARALYRERRDILVHGLHDAGWNVTTPDASMFVWAEIPPQFQPMDSLTFSKALLENAGVAVAPGVGFGTHGDTHVRFALVENIQRTRQACRNIKRFFNNASAVSKSKEKSA